MDGTALCGTGEQGLSHPQCGLSLSSQFCPLMHTKQSSALVRLNLQDNFDREQEFRQQWPACKMCIGESPDAPSSVPCCPEDSLWMVYINICPYSTQGLCSALLENCLQCGALERIGSRAIGPLCHMQTTCQYFLGQLLGWGWSCGWGRHAFLNSCSGALLEEWLRSLSISEFSRRFKLPGFQIWRFQGSKSLLDQAQNSFSITHHHHHILQVKAKSQTSSDSRGQRNRLHFLMERLAQSQCKGLHIQQWKELLEPSLQLTDQSTQNQYFTIPGARELLWSTWHARIHSSSFSHFKRTSK